MSGERKRPEWVRARLRITRYERATMNSLAESIYTISGKNPSHVSCNLHKSLPAAVFRRFGVTFGHVVLG